MTKKITISQVVDATYCRRKVWIESRHGVASKPLEIQAKADRGTAIHAQHATASARTKEGCFVASCVYGEFAPETNRLRVFRDTRLMSYAFGRAFVTFYYWFSPALVRFLDRCPAAKPMVRAVLDRFVRFLGA